MSAIPVILDTDIGTDIDDTWALAMLLKSPELDLRLVTTADGDTEYRARLVARLLEIAGRSDVPVAVGVKAEQDHAPGRHQLPWVADYGLSRYPGPVSHDGVQALIDTVMSSPEPVTILSIGPLTNLRAALLREPRITQRARFVGMQGSIRVGYAGSATPVAEYNVAQDVASAAVVFSAPWEMTLTPVDTCGDIVLEGERYQRLLGHDDALLQAVFANYRVWSKNQANSPDPGQKSTVLFDTVAVYLAYAEEFVNMETLQLGITSDGFTAVKKQGKPIRCAMTWRDRGAYLDHLTQRLLAPITHPAMA